MNNPTDAFGSDDRFERLTRAQIAEILNLGLENIEEEDVDDVDHFADDDPRLTDEVCRCVVNEWANNGSSAETTLNTLHEFPEIRRKG